MMNLVTGGNIIIDHRLMLVRRKQLDGFIINMQLFTSKDVN